MICGDTEGYAERSIDFVLLALSEDLEGCSNLIENDVALQVTDATSHPDLVFSNIAFTEDLSYFATIPYNAVTPSFTDTLPQLSSLTVKELCPLVE